MEASNNGNDQKPAEPPTPPPHRAQLMITLKNDNSVEVHGPIQDMILSYGLLEIAKDTVRRYNEQKAKGGIIPWRGRL